jgi:uncharacterized membrane protein YfcA
VKRRIETSKKVLGAVLVFCILGIIASMVGWFIGLQQAPEMAGIFSGIVLTEIGFYTWKAKAENIQKYPKDHPYKDEPSDTNSANQFGNYIGG